MNPEQRKALLLSQASALFVEHGYEQVRIDDILETAGISKGGFYHHFTSKDDVLRLLIAQETTQLIDQISALQATDPVSKLIACFQLGSNLFDGTSGIIETLNSHAAKTFYINEIESSFDRLLKPALTELIKSGVQSNAFHPVDPDSTTELIMAVNNHANRKAILEDWPEQDLMAFSKAGISLLGTHLGIEKQLSKLQLERATSRKGTRL